MSAVAFEWLVLTIDASLKAVLLAAVVWLLLRLLNIADSNVRHRAWLGVLGGMLLLPMLSRFVPALQLPIDLPLERLILEGAPTPIVALIQPGPSEEPSAAAELPEPVLRTENSAPSASRPLAGMDFPRLRPAAGPLGNGRQPQPESLEPAAVPIGEAALAENTPLPVLAGPPPAPLGHALLPQIITALSTVWAAGTAVMLVRLLTGLVVARWMVRRSTRIVDLGTVSAVRECQLIRVPFTVGTLRPTILLPLAWRDWPPAKLAAVLAHERMHIERGDCAVALLAEIDRCMYWFHPLAWWLRNELSALAEAACDDAVIDTTGDRTAYARHLLEVAASVGSSRGRLLPLGVSMARQSNVETRIHSILDFTRPLSQRLTWTRALLLTAVMLPLIGFAAALQPASRARDDKGKAVPTEKLEETGARPGGEAATQENGDTPIMLTGTIVDAANSPLAGARIHFVPQWSWLYSANERKPRLLTKADEAGRFEFKSEAEQSDKVGESLVLITADGYAPEWFSIHELKELRPRVIKLARDDAPIRGRVLTLEGQPVPGAKITVESIKALHGGELGPFIDIVKAGNGSNYQFDRSLYEPPHIAPLESDAEGRFEIRGIGAGRVAELVVVGRTVQHARLQVMTIESEPIHARPGRGFSDLDIAKGHPPVFGRSFDWVAKPSRPIVGTVVDAKTREAIAGVGVGSLGEGHAKTDENGRFELLGCAKSKSYGLLLSTDNVKYLHGSARVADTPGLEPLEVTLELHQATVVSGRVIDKATGEPVVHARMTYFPLSPNPNLVRGMGGSEASAFGAFTQQFTAEDGTFSIGVLAGPGFIGVSAPNVGSFQPAAVDAVAFFKQEGVPYAIDPPDGMTKDSLLVAPSPDGQSGMPQSQYNAVELLNAPAQDELKLTHDIELIPAKSLAGLVLDPDGQPLSGVMAFGLTDRFGRSKKLPTSEFRVDRIGEEERMLVFRHEGRKLAGQIQVTAQMPQPIRVTLALWAEVTGQLIENEGAPLANMELQASGELKAGESRGHLPAHYSTDDDGRFQIVGLVPGLTYVLRSRDYAKPHEIRVCLKPGEKLNVGPVSGAFEHLATATTGNQAIDVAGQQREPAKSTPEPGAPQPNAKTLLPATDNSKQIRGRVIDVAGKPVAGAKLLWFRHVYADLTPMQPKLMATTSSDGQFAFTIPDDAAHEKDSGESASFYDYIVVFGEGHGFVKTTPHELHNVAAEPAGGLLGNLMNIFASGTRGTVRLPAAGQPIRGRLLNVDGQPVAGATVKIRWFDEVKDLGSPRGNAPPAARENAIWQERVNDFLRTIEPVELREALPSATTDASGRFELKGVGDNRLFHLLIQGNEVESANIVVRSQGGQPITIPPERGFHDNEIVLHPRDFTKVLGPSRPVVGRVFDLDTKEPIAGAIVRAYAIHGINLHSSRQREEFRTRTDAQGRYRITGLPIGAENSLVAFTDGDIAYIPVGHDVDTSKVKGSRVERDFGLKRGVWAIGRVFDDATGKPFTGQIEYYWFQNKQLEREIPGLRDAFVDERYWTNGDGAFRVPVLVSRGILAFRHSGSRDQDGIDRFARGFGAENIEGSETIGALKHFPTLPHFLIATNYERVAEVNPQRGQATVRVDMPLFASQPVKGRVVNASGEAVAGCEVYGLNERWGWQRKEAADFVIDDLRPKETRKIFAFHRMLGLAGGVMASHDGKQPLEIKLAPAGKVIGRLVDKDGEPITDAVLHSNYDKLHTDDHTGIWADHPTNVYNPSHIPVDGEGRFELDGLIPGWTYSGHATATRKINGQVLSNYFIGTVFDDLKVEAGEKKDLGPVRLKEEGANKQPELKDEIKPQPHDAKALSVRVVDENDRPVAGANLAATAQRIEPRNGGDLSPRGEVLAETTTDDNGQARLKLDGISSKTHRNASLIARQEGTAMAWQKIDLAAMQPEFRLKLVSEEPIRGRLIDIDGQPIAGVTLSVRGVMRRMEKEIPEEDDGVGFEGQTTPAAWIPNVTSDRGGRFTIHGLPAGHGVWLEARASDRVADQQIALNTGMPEQRGERDGTYRPLVRNAKPGEEIVLPLSPAQIFEGTIRYEDTKEPVVGGRVVIWASQQSLPGSMVSVEGKTDTSGRYRISPKPGIRFGLQAYPPDGAPYLIRQTTEDIPWETADRVKQQDLTLPRGVLVRGKVIDAVTKAPIAKASIQYHPEFSRSRPGLRGVLTGWQGIQLSDTNGEFQIAVLPGVGRLLAHAPDGSSYVLGEFGSNLLSNGKAGGLRNYAHAIERIEPAAGADAIEVSIELNPGAKLSGIVVDEQGRPAEETMVLSRHDIWAHSLHWRGGASPTVSGRFELHGQEPGTECPIYFLDATRRLGATVNLRAGNLQGSALQAGELQGSDKLPTVVLKPCGSATVRFVDKDGKPVADHRPQVQFVVTPGCHPYDQEAMRAGQLSADSDFAVNVDRRNFDNLKSDAAGKLTIPALVPGATYWIVGHKDQRFFVAKEFKVEPSQTLDLGDIVVERRE